MRPGSQGKLLGICLLGGVSLVVSVRHLFLGDPFLVCFFSPCCLSMLVCLVGSSFSFVVIYCCVITVVCLGFLGSGSLGGFLLVFFGAWKIWGFPLFLLLLYLVLVVFICFEYTELLPGWLTSEALLTRC